jgi:hypothetical protein
VEIYAYTPYMSAWRGQEQQHIILFVTSGGFQAELTILTYLKEDVANSPAVRNPVSLYLQNYYYHSYYYHNYYHCYYYYYLLLLLLLLQKR